MIKLLNPESDNIRNIIPLNEISLTTTSSASVNHHFVYDSSGKRLDSSKTEIITKDPEPWLNNKTYERTLAYLDDDKSIPLIIGESTVQVWRKRSSSTRVL